MLVIRNEQMDVLSDLPALEAPIRSHLREFFPLEMAGKSDQFLNGFIRQGCAGARQYGIDDAPGICKFIDLMVELGTGFDQQPQFGWVRQILRDHALGAPAQRLDRVAALVAAMQD